MARFTIWGRVEQVERDCFMVVASAMSTNPDGPGTSTVVLSERASGADEARNALDRLVARLDARVKASGGIVSSIDLQ